MYGEQCKNKPVKPTSHTPNIHIPDAQILLLHVAMLHRCHPKEEFTIVKAALSKMVSAVDTKAISKARL